MSEPESIPEDKEQSYPCECGGTITKSCLNCWTCDSCMFSKADYESSLDAIWHDYKSLENPADFEEIMAEHHFKNGFRAGRETLKAEWIPYFERMFNILHTQGTQEQGFVQLAMVISEFYGHEYKKLVKGE